MTIHYVDHIRQKIVDIGPASRFRSLVETERSQSLHHTPDGSADQARAGASTRRIADAKSDARSKVGQLTDDTLRRIAVYVAGGLVTGGVVLAASNLGCERHTWWGWLLIGAPLIWLSFLGLAALTFVALRVVACALRWSLRLTARMSAHARVGVPACLVALAGAFVVLVGPGAVRHAIALLVAFVFPCAVVIGVGGWLTVLTRRHRHDERRRWQRHTAYRLLALVAAAAILSLGARDTLAAEATVGLLFPVAVWLGVRTWRAMNRCSPIAVRVLIDIVVPLTLGVTLVALVWLGDALRTSSTQGATVREALRLAGNYANLPQWWWIGLYVVVAGASVLFARLYPQLDRLPVEATFSLLSPRQHPHPADRPASGPLASSRIEVIDLKDPLPACTARIRPSSYTGAKYVSRPLTTPACLGHRSLRSPRMPSHRAPTCAWRIAERCQPCRRCRRSDIAVHRSGVLCPHSVISGFGSGDRRAVLPEKVARDKRR
jgi:hypothetical protein